MGADEIIVVLPLFSYGDTFPINLFLLNQCLLTISWYQITFETLPGFYLSFSQIHGCEMGVQAWVVLKSPTCNSDVQPWLTAICENELSKSEIKRSQQSAASQNHLYCLHRHAPINKHVHTYTYCKCEKYSCEQIYSIGLRKHLL